MRSKRGWASICAASSAPTNLLADDGSEAFMAVAHHEPKFEAQAAAQRHAVIHVFIARGSAAVCKYSRSSENARRTFPDAACRT